MREEILPGLYRLEIPLPETPLKAINSYVVKGSNRNLVIDTGLNRIECLEAMEDGLEGLGIDLAKTDFFITHLHADHFGLVGKLVDEHAKTFFNRPDAEIIEAWEGLDPMVAYAGMNGFPEDQLRAAMENHPAMKSSPESLPELSIVRDGDTIEVGDYCFTCIQTPGHTKGHMCLYEASKKILVSGDHILIDITPNIQCWNQVDNPLKNYLASLNKVYDLDVELVLPGHRRLFSDHRQRIDELKRHHNARLDEVLRILKKGLEKAFQVASQMTWDIAIDSWSQFPVAQKWFATGEAIAHIQYLEQEGRVERITGSNGFTFSSV